MLEYLASTYSRENDAVYDGISFPGPRIINFAHVLKNEVFPLAKIVQALLELSSEAMDCPVEMEFAATLNEDTIFPAHFRCPAGPTAGSQRRTGQGGIVCSAEGICLVLQPPGSGQWHFERDSGHRIRQTDGFRRGPKSGNCNPGRPNELQAVRREVSPICLSARAGGAVPIPGLGIPVKWSQISGVRMVVEVSLPNMNVDPSQGSHFFQNMTSLRIGYFTIPLNSANGFIDWAWLESLATVNETPFLKHVRVAQPLKVMVDGRKSEGIILKPPGPTP